MRFNEGLNPQRMPDHFDTDRTRREKLHFVYPNRVSVMAPAYSVEPNMRSASPPPELEPDAEFQLLKTSVEVLQKAWKQASTKSDKETTAG